MNLTNYVAPLISFLSERDEYNRQMDMANFRRNIMNDYYRQQMNNATSAFNRDYYRNYLDNANSRNMLKRVREQLGEQAKAARNRAAITGATGESVAAMQKNNNRTLDYMAGSLAAADEASKERAAMSYDMQQQQLNNMMMTSTMKYYDDISSINKAKQDSWKKLLMGDSNILKRLADFIRQQPENNAWSEQMYNTGNYLPGENSMMP